MPSLLGPTNPVPGYDAQPVRITPPLPGDTTVQNVVDPSRVVRSDRRTDQQDAGDAANAARYDSNFVTFLQRLKGAQTLPDTFLRVLQGQGLEVTSGIRSGFAGDLAQFLEFLKMDEAQLSAFLRNQLQSGSRFGGALFQTLRNAYANTPSPLIREEILQFLRRYSDFSSTGHLEGKLLRTTASMTEALPGQWSDRLSALLAQLENGVAAGDRAGNLKLLQHEIFPLISRYVSLTHDHGLARGLLSMLTLDVARYENGAPEGLLLSLRHLAASNLLPEEFGSLSDADLLRLLGQTSFSQASQNNAFADQLALLTDRALRGDGGVNAQDAFHNILASTLINESVFMPLQHIMLPLDWDGRLMFSELWVDPDADREKGSLSGEGGTLRLLIKMDVADLGAFDVLIDARRSSVSLQVACPQEVSAFSPQVSQALRDILERNGLNAEEVRVQTMKRPIAISEAFPKLFERVSGVNVKV